MEEWRSRKEQQDLLSNEGWGRFLIINAQVHKRALYFRKRALYFRKRALYFRKRSAVERGLGAFPCHQRTGAHTSPIFPQKSPIFPWKNPIFPQKICCRTRAGGVSLSLMHRCAQEPCISMRTRALNIYQRALHLYKEL